jgi:hypothetical protein
VLKGFVIEVEIKPDVVDYINISLGLEIGLGLGLGLGLGF